MTLKLRRPARASGRPRFAEGGAVGSPVSYATPTAPVQQVDDRPQPAHVIANRALRQAGVDQPTAPQTAHVAQAVTRERSRGLAPGHVEAAVSRASAMHQPGAGLPAYIQAALDLRPAYARGGSIAPGLPAAPFASIPLPSVATPGLASPHGLIAARHRQHFAAGGPALPPHVLAALALRPRFEDGGEAGGDHGGSNSSGGGESGGGGDNGEGGSNSSSGDGGGSNSDSGSTGGHSDASTGGADQSAAGSGGNDATSSGGGFSPGAASGSDSSVSNAGLGAAPGQMAGSAGTMSSDGFGTASPSVGTGPATTSDMGGIQAGPTATAGSLGPAPSTYGGFTTAPSAQGFTSTPSPGAATASDGDDGLGMPHGWSGQDSAAAMQGYAPSGTASQDGQIPGSAPTVSSAFSPFGAAQAYSGVEATQGAVPDAAISQMKMGIGSDPDAAGVAVTPYAGYGSLSPAPLGATDGLTGFNPYTGTYNGYSTEDEGAYRDHAFTDTYRSFGRDEQTPASVAGLNSLQGQPSSEASPGVNAFGGNLDKGIDGLGTIGSAPGAGQFDRYSFARGGHVPSSLPPHIRDALLARQHFDDGGEAGGSDRGGSGASSSGGDNGGSGEGNSSSSSSSGGSDNSSAGSSTSSGGHSDASTGGADTSSASSNSSSGESTAGGHSDASPSGGYGGNSDAGSSTSSSGGQSDASTSGGYGSSATGGTGGGVEGSAGLGGYGSATSGPVNSIAGSVGAPAAGGFSSEGAPATGGFGSFGPTPTASSNLSGLSGPTPTASSLSGETAQQSMAREAASPGDPGEDGTGANGLGLGPAPTTAQAFSSFGPSPASPYGSTANAQTAFGGTQASDLAGSSLSPTGQALGMMGLGAMPSGLAQNPTGYASPGAYGLSTTANGVAPGFDNFSSTGALQQSSLGLQGWTGFGEGLDPNQSYSTFSGVMPGSMINAMEGDLPGAEAKQTDVNDLANSFKAEGLPFDGMAPNATAYGPGPAAAAPAAAVAAPGPGLGAQPTGTTPGLNADGDPTAVAGVSALTIHGNQTEAAQGGYDAPGPVTRTFGGITDQQAFTARQNIANGTGTAADQAIASGYQAQQNSPVGRTVGLGLGAAPSSVTASAPGSLAGLGAAPDTAGAPSPPDTAGAATSSGFDYGDYNTHVQHVEDPTGHATNPTTGAYGAYQITGPTYQGIIANNPGLGLPANARNMTQQQQVTAVNALTTENLAALKNAGLAPTYANAYATHLLGAPTGIRTLTAPNNTPIGNVVSADAITNNAGMFKGVQTVGDFKAKMTAVMGAGVISGAASATAGGLPASVQAALQNGPANYSPGAASGMDTTDTAAPSMNPGISPPSTWSPGAPSAPTTQTVTSPAPYGVSPATSTTLGNYGMTATPANAMAAETFGFGVASQVMNGDPNDPVSSAGISDAAMAANPSLFSGVQTIGDLQARITKAAETAGTTTSTVTTPGAPAQPGALPGYSYSPGAASGLDSVDPSAASFGISQPGVYGTPTAATAPAGAPATSTPSTSTGTPDTATPSHLSVPAGITNTAANLGLGIFGGPIGAGIAAVNGISGLLGGPTIADGINGILSGSSGGTPTGSMAGLGANSSQAGATYPTLPAPYGPSTGSSDGSGSSSEGPTSSGVNPLDPHATAMAAYQAAIAGNGGSSTGAPSDTLAGYRHALTIRGPGHHAIASAPTTSLYNPMQDPSVLRALGLD